MTDEETKRAKPLSLKLEIDPVIARADALAELVERELPNHPGLARVSRCVAKTARDAREVSLKLKKPWGLHRLPIWFVVLALCLLAVWSYWQFVHVEKLRIAIPERDAINLRTSLNGRFRMVVREAIGSAEAVELLKRDQVDLAFVQGGIDFPKEYPCVELDDSELVLFFQRSSIASPSQIRTILTSSEGQGSHRMAQLFTKIWRVDNQVTFLHDWRTLTDDPSYRIDDAIDAVFVVKDLLAEDLEPAFERLEAAGFRLVSPDIGSLELRYPYLKSKELSAHYLSTSRRIPSQSVVTYRVAAYLVGSPRLNAQQLAAAESMLHPQKGFPRGMEPTLNTASEVVQGLEATLGIVVYLGVAFLGLMGLDLMAYRKRFHELNSLVSLISMHQSSKDVLIGSPELKAHHVAYLSVCSDLLGLIAVITGYYTQENTSLIYNRIADIIHERCNGLKINIQLKILHATIDLPNADVSEFVSEQTFEAIQPTEMPSKVSDSVD